jgi:hypothetical protein
MPLVPMPAPSVDLDEDPRTWTASGA